MQEKKSLDNWFKFFFSNNFLQLISYLNNAKQMHIFIFVPSRACSAPDSNKALNFQMTLYFQCPYRGT